MTLNEDDGSSFSFPEVADCVETLLSLLAELLLTSRLLVMVSGKDWNETFRLACSCSLYFAFFARRSVIIDLGEGPEIGVKVIVIGRGQQTQKSRQVMRRCLQLQPGSLGCRRLSSRSLATSTGQASWRVTVQNKNGSVNALMYIAPDDAGTVYEGPLQGMTVAVKDNICTKNMPTTCSSAMLRGKHSPLAVLACASFIVYALDFKSPYDATVVQLLSDSGATIIGKTNCDEFGMGYDCVSFVGHLAFHSKPQVSQHPFRPWTSRQPVPTPRELRRVGCARTSLGWRQLRR